MENEWKLSGTLAENERNISGKLAEHLREISRNLAGWRVRGWERRGGPAGEGRAGRGAGCGWELGARVVLGLGGVQHLYDSIH